MERYRSNMVLLLLIFAMTMLIGVESQNPDVALAVKRLLTAKKQIDAHMRLMKKEKMVAYQEVARIFIRLPGIRSKKGNKGVEDLISRERSHFKAFVGILKNLKQRAKEFYDALKVSSLDGSSRDSLNSFREYAKANEDFYISWDYLLSSFTLAYNNNRRAGLLFRHIRRSITNNGRVQMKDVCLSVKTARDNDPHSLPDFSLADITVTEICPDVNSCTRKSKIYSDKRNNTIPLTQKKKEEKRRRKAAIENKHLKYIESEVWEACIILGQPEDRSKCNIQQAIPMMTGMLKYQINEMIYQNLCPKNCKSRTCNSKMTYERLIEDINRLIGFTASLQIYYIRDKFWPKFFNDALRQQAFSKLNVALKMIQDKKDDFQISGWQCNLVKYKDACPYVDILRQFNLLKKIQDKRNGNVRVKDLRQHAIMNHAEMLKLQKDDLKHAKLIGKIKQLDNNLKASVKGISNYFVGLAKFDEGIAKADVDYIKSKLNTFESGLKKVQTELINNIKEAINKMQYVLAGNLGDAIFKLATTVALNSNPLKAILTGPDLTEVLDRAGEVANAASQAVRGSALYKSINGLANDAHNLNDAFKVNSRQLTSLDKLVNKIKSGQSANVGVDADKFLIKYGAYTPTADLSKLEKNNALWSAFKDSICDILYGDVGIGGSVPKSIAGGKLVCEKLEGTLAQYFTLRAQIYDFQFDLVDSLAAVVRGNIAKRLSTEIDKGRTDLMDAKQMMIGFLAMQYKIQKVASVYCDILQYKQLGKPVAPCSTVDGLFREQNINRMIAYPKNNRNPHTDATRFVYIPTRAETGDDIDTGIVDLDALSKGQQVVFKIPVNQTWLEKYEWLLPGETKIPFIKSMELFLPHKTYNGRRVLKTQIWMKSVAGSSVTTRNPTTNVVYMLPDAPNSYRTIYEEGYSSCSSNEINNPYSLCGNLPKICIKSMRISSSETIFPTILSTFSLKAKITQGRKKVKYDAPSPETPLLLRAKVILKIPLANTKKSDVPQLVPRSGVVISKDGCCKGQYYRLSKDDKRCGPCPQDTTAYHGGLYCQINEKKTK